jgi:hypothetical protein
METNKSRSLISLLALTLMFLPALSDASTKLSVIKQYGEVARSHSVRDAIEVYFNKWSNNGNDYGFQVSPAELSELRETLTRQGLDVTASELSGQASAVHWECFKGKQGAKYFLVQSDGHLAIQKSKTVHHKRA